ncbi:MAG: 3-hydroxyacyl-CoA dehydrogenase [Saprospiraceae bacterium]|jgi:3-hydroxyacyl-CoA dehydrogenase
MKQVNQIHSIAIIGNGLMGQGMAWHRYFLAQGKQLH